MFKNPPQSKPRYMIHKTFYSNILKNDLGYNIYLPRSYYESENRYPVSYHIHGWKGNESSDIWAMKKVYSGKEVITVFLNAVSLTDQYFEALLQIESIFIQELIPHIDEHYRTDRTREKRMLSGFSMGGNMAFYFAVKHWDLFGSVTVYAGTYHHLYNKGYRTVGIVPEKAMDLFKEMMTEKWYLEETNILYIVRQNADNIRGKLSIDIHIGTRDILFCDNEIMHLYLEELKIPHRYNKFDNVQHSLKDIL